MHRLLPVKDHRAHRHRAFFISIATRALILRDMQQPATSEPPPSFAGVLSTFAAHEEKQSIHWEDDDLAEDVIMLSYESALRAHSRYRTPTPTAQSLQVPGGAQPADQPSAWEGPLLDEAISSPSQRVAPDAIDPPAGPFPLPERNRKCASITVRLSKEECDQLRQRSAEAGLTVSAYLRSCTFEAESLRALVKETLAELRSKATQGKPLIEKRACQTWAHWLARLLRLNPDGEPALRV